jgi:hypothetical protein
MKKEEETLIIEPFEGCNFKVEVNLKSLKKKKGSKLRPFPHNMQLNNKHLLQEKYYHLFDGDAAIYLKDAQYINFSRSLFNIPFEEMGKPMIIIGYNIMNCNPHFTEEQLYDCLHHIASYYIQIPDDVQWLNAYILELGYTEFMKKNLERIKKAASQVYNTPYKGSLEKRNQVIFNPDYVNNECFIEERTEIRNKVVGKNRRKNRVKEIYSTLLNWDSEEKPIQENVAKKLGVSKRTVATYWQPAKEKLKLPI